MNKFFVLLLSLTVMLITIPSVLAFGPNTHFNITMTALEQSNNSLIKNIIEDNFDSCLSGLEYPDVGIFEYFTNFKNYAALHNYNVVDEMLRLAKNDKDRAFAYCYKIHLSEDAVSHNYYVPVAIKKSKIPNYLIHPIEELKIEARYLDTRTERLMENHAAFDELVAKANNRDWSAEAEKLNVILGGGQFYVDGYAPESTTFIGKAQVVMYKFVYIFVSPQTGVDYYTQAIEEAKGVLRGETSPLDPAGAAALGLADASTSLWLYIGSFVLILAIFIISWKYKIIGW